MLVEIPEQWLTDPPSPASMRVWFAIASASVVMTIPEIMKRTGLNARTVARGLEALAGGGLIEYLAGSGKVQSLYVIAGGMDEMVQGGCTKPSIPEPNDSADLSGGLDETVHTPDDFDLFPDHRRAPALEQTTINSTVKDLTKLTNCSVKNKRVPYKQIIGVFEAVVVTKYSHIQYGPPNAFPASMGGTHKGTLSTSKLGLAIKREWNKHSDIEWFEAHFNKTLTDCLDVSEYHLGHNDDDWCASMFWLLCNKCQNNIKKGQYLKQYSKPTKTNGNGRTKTADDFFPDEGTVIDIKAENQGGNIWQL